MDKKDIGVVGMAVMGQSLALNMESKGFSVAVYNRTLAKTKKFAETKASGKNILPAYSIKEFVNSLATPRKILLMVKSGPAVDAFIEQFKPYLSPGDVLIDGGNSFFGDTARRVKELEKDGILYIGTGISGGEEGALKGPCIMPGGQEAAYRLVEPILTKIAAQVEEGPCCSYIGPGAAGHYVKMVHNGIEYGCMQLIAETYDIMKNILGLQPKEIGKIFAEWNKGSLGSYLIEITADIFNKIDAETNQPLVDLILDKAAQKGTGKWTSQNALDLGVPVPTIDAAVEARILSGYKEERVMAAKILFGPAEKFTGDQQNFVSTLQNALYSSEITAYAQGMVLLYRVSQEYNYNLNLSEIAQIWKGGCIIRAKVLDKIKSAYQNNPELPNLLVDPYFADILNKTQTNWRRIVETAVGSGVPVLAMSASLSYFDAYRRESLPANLIQAQRDYFGAHTYQRIDKEGTFHTHW